MKVCLINPPVIIQRYEDYEYDESWHTLPHLGLGYIATSIESAGIEVEVVECIGHEISLKELFIKLEKEKYDAIGISTYYYNAFYVYKIITRLKMILPSSFVFVGGYLPTLSYEQVLNSISGLDCCVIGEGELTCKELMECICHGRDWRNVPGIAYKEGNEIVKTESRPLLNDLDILPFPKRAFFAKKGFASLITSRGCYGDCIFCATSKFFRACPGNPIRSRTAEKSVEEIEYLVKSCCIKDITILDDNFTLRSKKRLEWIDRFCSLIKEKNLKVKLRIVTRADEFANGYEALSKLKDVGLEKAFIGIECFADRQLEFYNKKVNTETNIKAIEIARNLDIKLDIGWVIFDPFTTVDEVLMNVRTLKELRFHEFVFDNHMPFSIKFPLMPFMDTDFYYLLKDKNMYDPKKDVPYKFEDDDVDLCYSVIKLWIKKIFPVHIKYYLILKAGENGEYALEKELREEKHKLMKLDTDFLEELCLKIKAKEISLNNSGEFLSQWEEKLQPVFNRFMEAERVLEKFS